MPLRRLAAAVLLITGALAAVRAADGSNPLIDAVKTGDHVAVRRLVALKAGQLGSAIEVVNRFGSYFYGSILGVFGLAILTPRASARGAFYGLIAGMTTVYLVSRFTSIAFLWYNVVGAVTSFGKNQTCAGTGGGYRVDQPDDLAWLATFGLKPS